MGYELEHQLELAWELALVDCYFSHSPFLLTDRAKRSLPRSRARLTRNLS